MSLLKFSKYQGAGNDFIIIDNRDRNYDSLDVARLCHPKFGIGADGLMLLQNKKSFDFEMVYYNSDGNPSSMCGNGGRCLVDFARNAGAFAGDTCRFLAIDGPHNAIWTKKLVELQMQDVPGIRVSGNDFILNTGSPHFVRFCEDVNRVDLIAEAHKVRYGNEFKAEGINVNYVQVIDNSNIKVRTYERGVENETLSCGTGVTASSIVLAALKNFSPGHYTIHIETPGGKLFVKYNWNGDGSISDVWLCGAATIVFEGSIDI